MKYLVRFLMNIDLIIANIALSLIVIITVSGVVMRKVVGEPIAWLEEAQILLFIWCIFFGASVAFREGGHVGIDLIAARLKDNTRKILDFIIYGITLFVLVYMVSGSYDLTLQVTKKVTPYLKIPYSYIDMAAPIGCVLMIIQYTTAMYKKYFFREQAGIGKEGNK